MDKIVSLCKRRGFVFPSSEIYGGLGSSYDYGHYGVLLKNNVKGRVVARDAPGARRHRRAGLGDHPAPAHMGGERATWQGSPIRSSTAAPASCASAPTTSSSRPCGRKPSKHPGETPDCDLTEAREFNLMFETTVGPGEGGGLDRLPAPRDRPGHLPQLQERTCSSPARSRRSGSPRSASRSATRSRPATSSSARASSSRWRWSSSCRPTRRSSGSSTGSSSG